MSIHVSMSSMYSYIISYQCIHGLPMVSLPSYPTFNKSNSMRTPDKFQIQAIVIQKRNTKNKPTALFFLISFLNCLPLCLGNSPFWCTATSIRRSVDHILTGALGGVCLPSPCDDIIGFILWLTRFASSSAVSFSFSSF